MGERTYHKACVITKPHAKLRPGLWVYWTEKDGKSLDITHRCIPKGAKVIDETHNGPNP
jgi:hypothetical protein